LIQGLHDPRDLRALTPEQLTPLAAEIRSFLVEKVSATGGHLGPNLGVVELTIALHRVFNSPDDAIIWDTGHQAYVHKIVTGRAGEFDTLRQEGGLSGYPSRTESIHDLVENSHASTSISYADGLAKAWEQRGLLGSHHVVAVIGDGALTGGMAWEALNNIAGSDRQVIIVVNDNGRSYSPTIGGLAHHLSTLRTTHGYERFMSWGKRVLHRTPVFGRTVYGALHGMKKGVKDIVAPQGMFEDLGLKYVGPVDGHDELELEHALRRAKAFPGPVIVHAITQKGQGYAPAEEDEADKFHGVGVIDPDTGKPITSSGPTWTSTFGEEMLLIGAERSDVVAVTAAMLGPTGLNSFARQFPTRIFDVGIAEQHAATSAAGLAMGGAHPVVALYATFLNRAFDQVLFDCALHGLGVTFALDRAGITGDDGPSHNGIWDLSILGVIPGVRVAAPRDASNLRALLREAVAVTDAPTVVRYPKGAVSADIVAAERHEGFDLLARHGDGEVLVIGIGAMAAVAVEVGERLSAQGYGASVIDPRWVKPLHPSVVDSARDSSLVIVIEDGIRQGGIGSAMSQAMGDAGIDTPIRTFGVDRGFLPQAKRPRLLAEAGLTAQDITLRTIETLAGRSDSDVRESTSQPLGD
jgi:1-deoxy-D-xylulose-5-phosphate synthase